jgi:acyl-coenzyme A synthetase/AMP-(fatty) acid ligase
LPASPDAAVEHLPSVIADAEAHAIVHDGAHDASYPGGLPTYPIHTAAGACGPVLPSTGQPTEWCLFTSGTTGAPKMVAHSLAGLIDAIPRGVHADPPPVWATFYDVRRFGGLQMLLRSLVGGHTLYMPGNDESLADFLARIAPAGVTHLAGTPTHWRSALITPGLAEVAPGYVRLSGEIADQPVLDRLAAMFPGAARGHAFASTEAGVVFEVSDGQEGFPAAYLDRPGKVELKIEDDTLRIRSPRVATRYLGEGHGAVAGLDGFVDTGDIIERRGERLYFMGRANGVINVGGLKVNPEEVEAVVNRCPGVRMSRVKGRSNPITGAIVTAEVVLADPAAGQGDAARETRNAILEACRAALPLVKVPASVRFVETLPMSPAGKLDRRQP